MASEPRTVGEKVDRDGPCELMSLVADLAQKRGRIPVRHWTVELHDGWTLEVNGTAEPIGHIPPWHSMMTHRGLPIVLFDAADGTALGLGGEDAAIAALKHALNEESQS